MSTRQRASREAKVEALHQQLAESVGALVTGEDWKRALAFAAQFRSRSFNNTMLIYAQHHAAHLQGRVPNPTPTYVAGFHQWIALDRHVMKGQHGYGILGPVTARFATRTPADPESWRRLAHGEKPGPGDTVRSKLVGLKPTHVWDVSQTAGDPLPELSRPALLEGQAPVGLWDGLADQITGHGFELRLVSSATSIGGANGLTDFLTREVSIRTDMDDAAQVKTLAHEFGHVLLHAPRDGSSGSNSAASSGGAAAGGTSDTAPEASNSAAADATLHRGTAEVEAESVALMVAAAHGLDTSAYTVPYVSTWATRVPGKTPVEVVQATAERVRRTALGILDNLDTLQVSDGNPPGLDRTHTQSASHADRPAAQQIVHRVGSRDVGAVLGS